MSAALSPHTQTHSSAVSYRLAYVRLLRFSQQLLRSYKKPPPWRGYGWSVRCCYLRKLLIAELLHRWKFKEVKFPSWVPGFSPAVMPVLFSPRESVRDGGLMLPRGHLLQWELPQMWWVFLFCFFLDVGSWQWKDFVSVIITVQNTVTTLCGCELTSKRLWEEHGLQQLQHGCTAALLLRYFCKMLSRQFLFNPSETPCWTENTRILSLSSEIK